MPAKRLPWFKLWPESFDHEKIATLGDPEFRTWVMLIGKASCQPTRWRFASITHASKVCGRSEEQISNVIAARLLDERSDGLWIHDWEQWQERYPSEFEDSRERSGNAPPTLTEDSANAAPTLPPTLPRARAKTGEGRREKGDGRKETEDVDEAEAREEIHEEMPVLRSPTAKTKRKQPTIAFADDEQEVINAFCSDLAEYAFDQPPQFWRKVLGAYGRLDLEGESLKMADWLRRHKKRQCSGGFVLNWLAKAFDEAPLNVRNPPSWGEPVLVADDVPDDTPLPPRLQPGCTACAWGVGEHAAHCAAVRAEAG